MSAVKHLVNKLLEGANVREVLIEGRKQTKDDWYRVFHELDRVNTTSDSAFWREFDNLTSDINWKPSDLESLRKKAEEILAQTKSSYSNPYCYL